MLESKDLLMSQIVTHAWDKPSKTDRPIGRVDYDACMHAHGFVCIFNTSIDYMNT